MHMDREVEGWTTSGTMVTLLLLLTGTETSQVTPHEFTSCIKQAAIQYYINHAPEKMHADTVYNPDCLFSTDNGDGTCVAMTTGAIGGFWDDKPCSEQFYFVCEKRRPDISPPTEAPTPEPSHHCAEGWAALLRQRSCYRVCIYSSVTL